MGKEAGMDIVGQIKRLLWRWEGGGFLNHGDIGGNTKKWTDLENQQNLITVSFMGCGRGKYKFDIQGAGFCKAGCTVIRDTETKGTQKEE